MKQFAVGLVVGALVAGAAGLAWLFTVAGRVAQVGSEEGVYRMTAQQAHHALTGER